MKSWRTIAILTMGVTIGYVNGLEAIALTLKSKVQQLPNQQHPLNYLTQALTPEQVNLRAKQVTVRIDGANIGSGSIIQREGDIYTVLSNWHVMKNSGEYIIQTIDGRTHQVDPTSIKQLPELDLAVFKFSSKQNYQLAEIGNSSRLNEGQNVYFTGYPGELRQEDNRYYRFFTVNLVGILPTSTENGYSLIYNGEAFPGMSGGPVFDKNGLLVGIHGEANINAITGGTSNYAIPIDTYKQAIAKLESAPEAENTPPSQPVVENPTPPQVTVDTKPVPESETPTPPESNSSNETETSKPPEISSVPTLSDSEPSNNTEETQQSTEEEEPNSANNNETADDSQQPTSQSEESNPVEANNDSQQSTEEASTSASNNETSGDSQQEANQPSAIFDSPTAVASTNPANSSTINNNPQKLTLISKATGIDYTKLRDLLKEKKWEEADLHTYKLIDQIIKTAKKQNRHIFIELKTIAEFSCNDIRTIDALWKKYSGDKFGFSLQQKIWQNVNQNGDFSTETWRRFATEVGWKQGDIASSSGYLLYDELDFDPQQAPTGHLPWWFALADEEQNVIKHLFARCDFNPRTPQIKPKSPVSPEGDRQGDGEGNRQNNDDSAADSAKKPQNRQNP